MNIKRLLISTAFSALLNISSLASAQVLGGGVTGGLGGSITGGLGNIGATGNGALNGSLGASSDALERGRDAGSRIRDKGKQTVDGAREHADATSAVSATGSAAGEAGSDVTIPQGEQMGDVPMLDVAGNGSGNASGMLDLDQKPAPEPVKPVDETPSSGRERERGQRNGKPMQRQPATVTGPALTQHQGSGHAEAQASGDGNASANANASVDADAKVED